MAHGDSVETLLDALAVTAELTGTELTKAAARVMVADLQAYPLPQVLAALTRCRRELKGRLTLAAILERLDDGRPGPQEAWAMIPQDEAGSVVWTAEMAAAFGVAGPLLRQGQVIAARQAFVEVYERECARARTEVRAPRWTPSLGTDKALHSGALETAARLGRISDAVVAALLPSGSREASNVHLLSLARHAPDDGTRRKLSAFARKLGGGE